MNNKYLIPANAKKSQLILGFFTPVDLTIFVSGCVVSLALLLILGTQSLGVMLLLMMPAFIVTFLIMPVPHYHNVLQLLTNVFSFFTNRRRYYWKGWCVNERFNTSNK